MPLKERIRNSAEIFLPCVLGFALFLTPQNLAQLNSHILTGALDELSFIWIFDRLSHNIFHFVTPLFDGKMFYPENDSLLYSETTFFLSMLYGIFKWMVSGRFLAYHLTLFFALAANYGSMYLFLRLLTHRRAATFGSLVFAFSMVRLAHLQHARLLPQLCFPLFAYGAVRLAKSSGKDRTRFAIFSGAILASQFYFSVSLGLILAVSSLPYFFFQLLRDRKSLVITMATLGVLIVPIYVPYQRVMQRHHFRRELGEALSASVRSFLVVPPGQIYEPILVGKIMNGGPGSRQEKNLCLGLTVFALAYFGLRRLKEFPRKIRRLVYLSLGFVVLLTLGKNAGLYNLLYPILPGMKGMRVPARFGLAYLFYMSALAAWGFAYATQQVRSRPKRGFLIGALFLFFFAENHLSLTGVSPSAELDGAVNYLAHHGKNPILHLPFQNAYADSLRMLKSLDHGHPIANGYAGFHAVTYFDFLAAEDNLRHDCQRGIAVLRKKEIGYIVLDKNYPLLDSQKIENCLGRHGKKEFDDTGVALYALSRLEL